MRRRIFLTILLISVITSSVASILTTYVYYNFYVKDSKQELKTIVTLAAEPRKWDSTASINSSVNSILKSVDYSIRFTIINEDGSVVYDNWKDEINENHRDRPEVQGAFEEGYGEDLRHSNTLSSDMYYYAVKLNDDEVLRLSREISSINSVFAGLMPMLLMLFIIVLVIVYIAASITAKKILKPINEMTKSLDDMLEEESKVNMKIYEEFEPLSNTIKDQKNKINEYINEIKYERDNISFITSNMKEGFILLNHNKDILSINKSGKIMIGNENFELKGNRNIFELTRSPEIIEKINDSIKENKHLIHDVETSDKCYRYYFSPVVEQNKIIKGLLILIEDITIQKKSEIMRSEFTANVSHELKTPLTTMIGFAEMIKEGLITGDDIEKYSALIHKEGMRLISLIEDLMRLSKIQEHTQNVEEKLINIKDISEDVVNLLKSKAEDYNVKLILNADNVVMKANNNYINELLYNLIDNGIKYNKDGGSVNIKIYEKDGLANIVISDTGVGIPPKHIDRIFERFYRVDKSRSKETGGTGLGLSIVKHIAELYDGTIDIKSSSSGTRIMIKFPVKPTLK
ncbi:MAG: ATP-binding protein [Tissierellia bacterium]|jgi:two-component system phosphate regulon sensor histidine kinase PhoR|nr:ATP-binding protein [Tissierellia bacterium]